MTHIVVDRREMPGANDGDGGDEAREQHEAEVEAMLRKEGLRAGGCGGAFVVDVSWVFDMSRGFEKVRGGIDLLMAKNKHYLVLSY